jgi:hypothetical protein
MTPRTWIDALFSTQALATTKAAPKASMLPIVRFIEALPLGFGVVLEASYSPMERIPGELGNDKIPKGTIGAAPAQAVWCALGSEGTIPARRVLVPTSPTDT